MCEACPGSLSGLTLRQENKTTNHHGRQYHDSWATPAGKEGNENDGTKGQMYMQIQENMINV